MENLFTPEQFEIATRNRSVIDQAKGMLMQKYEISAQQAFNLLSQLSQDTNVKVFDISRKLINREVTV